ncbi:ABC-type phosphate transport system substrate-binding protein [Chitinivorax tropicus]|uniref:ABC-type phosphate transport system substrate-binding protein n=1 Tax=Chitinivorax tropicus TaxID=714531 RepID=A0A840MHA2_9PROT|nr:substrate-binding domain-containing protein [Chitinivorax tropicus]MBB5017760.1 ABC-type phosphate transport system substrate-binding protein [Chitinivorax tropicus]
MKTPLVRATLIMLLLAPLAKADIAVIVSAKSSAGNLTADQVSQIFLGKSNSFPGGGQAVPVDQSEGAGPREEFYTKVTGKSAAQVKAYWSKLIFSGKGQPPKEIGNDGAVKKLIADNPNMIGYIDKGAVDSSVKVVLSQ